jgi:hypothetical protein
VSKASVSPAADEEISVREDSGFRLFLVSGGGADDAEDNK